MSPHGRPSCRSRQTRQQDRVLSHRVLPIRQTAPIPDKPFILPRSKTDPTLAALQNIVENLIDSSLERGTRKQYNTAVRSWFTFVDFYGFEDVPTPSTLALCVGWSGGRIYHVDKYLSGLAHHFRPRMTDWDAVRDHPVVKSTLRGQKKASPHEIHRKLPLRVEHLDHFAQKALASNDYDDLAFAFTLCLGFYGVMRLGELASPNKRADFDARKVVQRASFLQSDNDVRFHLPYHKADHFFEGATVMIHRSHTSSKFSFSRLVRRYIRSRDAQFGPTGYLLLLKNGRPPTRACFIRRLRTLVGSDYAGHSLRSGGATWYTSIGCSYNVVKRLGRWKSDTFEAYIRCHDALWSAMFGTHKPNRRI